MAKIKLESSQFIFESDNQRNLFASLYPQLSANFLSLNSFLPAINSAHRMTLAKTLFQNFPEPEKLLFTLERLRESLILTEEHIEYCFSALPPTPKNESLKKALLLYLKSELKNDFTEHSWKIIGELKEKKKEFQLKPHLYFIGELPFLLHELALAFTYLPGVETSQVIAPHEMSLGTEIIPHPLTGKESECLYTYANEVKKMGSNSTLLFTGSPKSTFFLKNLLASFKITEVHLIPFQEIPSLNNKKLLAYVDNEIWDIPMDNMLLSFSEIEILNRAGFSLPRYITYREKILTTLHYYATHPDIQLITPLDLKSLINIPSQKIFLSSNQQKLQPDVQPDSQIVPIPLKSLSATQLETYAECPSKYFFNNRLKLRRAQSSEEQYALIFGQAVHLALENYLKKDTWKDNPVENLKFLFSDALKSNPDPIPSNLITLLETHFEKIIPRFLKIEDEIKNRFGKTNPLLLEAPFKFEKEGLTFTGKIDRIEATNHGLLILDYKTGNIDFSPIHISQGVHFQTLLYLMGVSSISTEKTIGMLFYDLKKGELKRGILFEEEITPAVKATITRGHSLNQEKWEQIKEEGFDQLKTLADFIRDGVFQANPNSNHCSYCDYAQFCRKGFGYV